MKKYFVITSLISIIALNLFGQSHATLGSRHTSTGSRLSNTIYKPGLKIEANWDSASQAWNFYDSTHYTYSLNTRNVLTEKSSSNKLMHYYNSQGKKTSDTSMFWNGVSYNYNFCNTYVYDAKGHIIKSLNQIWDWWNDSSKLSNSNLEIFDYDSNGNLTLDSYQYWNNTTMEWNNEWRDSSIWDSGNLLEDIYQESDSIDWHNVSKYDYAYSNGQFIAGSDYAWNGSNWIEDFKDTDIVWYSWTGSLDQSKLQSAIEQYPAGNVWKDSLKFILTYDVRGNETSETDQVKTDSVFSTVYGTKYIYTLDKLNNIIQELSQNWVNDSVGFVNDHRIDYQNYSGYLVSGIRRLSTESNFDVFPNPFNLQTTILFKEPVVNNTVRIFNVQGQEVKSLTFTGSQLTLEKEQLKNGIYILQISDENNNIMNRRIVVQ